jgi:hypothetical protein
VHFAEEYLTRFHERFPRMLGIAQWSDEFFVTFNVLWVAVWAVSAIGVWSNVRAAFFPAWFLAIGMVVNGVAHPLLAVANRGYFPGLITSPVVGVVGALFGLRLWQVTAAK